MLFFVPKNNDLMNGIFTFYRKKSLPSSFIEKRYLKISASSGDPTNFIGTGRTDETSRFATDSVYGSWMKIEMKYHVYVTHYSVYQSNNGYDNRYRNWKFDGSIDGKKWFSLDDYSVNENTSMQKEEVPYLFTVQKPATCKYVKLIMYRTARTADESKYHLVFSGFEIFGIIDNKTCLVTMRKSYNIPHHFLFVFIYQK